MNASRLIAGGLCFGLFVSSTAQAASESRPASRPVSAGVTAEPRTEVFKRVSGVELKVHIFVPPGHKESDRQPAIVFFFGGGWLAGSPRQFFPQCRYLASRGMVAVAAEYRVYTLHKAQVADCVTDAKSAIRWVRGNAKRLGVDAKRIAAGGGSAGGHLAAAAAMLDEFDDAHEERAISSRPDALVLYNPALDLVRAEVRAGRSETVQGGIAKRLGAKAEQLSPIRHIKRGAPPTIIFHGTEDRLVPHAEAEAFVAQMKKAGNRAELVSFAGEGHSFFNPRRKGGKPFRETLRAADRFLASLGYVAGEPTIDQFQDPVTENQ